MFKTLVSILFSGLLLVGVPALSYSTARNPQIRQLPRMALYLSAIISQWSMAALGLGVVYVAVRDVLRDGFAFIPLAETLRWGMGIALPVLVGLCFVIILECHGWLPRESELVHRLIPETPGEKLWAVCVVAPTAAICEEFLYRGYLLAQIHDWLHSWEWAWLVCSVAFGLAHFYQGWGGMIRAGLLGALLAFPVVRLGNLYPPMLAHWLIDAVALVVLGPWMIRSRPSIERGTLK